MKDSATLLEAQLEHASLKHPQTTGAAKRVHVLFNTFLQCNTDEHWNYWHKYVLLATFLHNTSYRWEEMGAVEASSDFVQELQDAILRKFEMTQEAGRIVRPVLFFLRSWSKCTTSGIGPTFLDFESQTAEPKSRHTWVVAYLDSSLLCWKGTDWFWLFCTESEYELHPVCTSHSFATSYTTQSSRGCNGCCSSNFWVWSFSTCLCTWTGLIRWIFSWFIQEKLSTGSSEEYSSIRSLFVPFPAPKRRVPLAPAQPITQPPLSLSVAGGSTSDTSSPPTWGDE